MGLIYLNLIDDFKDYLKELSLYQFRESNIYGLINGYADQLNEVQDVLMDISGVLDIDTATGYNLNLIGIIVGYEREGSFPDDETYRAKLKRKIELNVNSGEPDKIIKGIKFLYDIPDEYVITISFIGNANYTLFIDYELVNPSIEDFYKITGAGIGVDAVYGSSGNSFRYGSIDEVDIVELGQSHGYSGLSDSILSYTLQNNDTLLLQNNYEIISNYQFSDESGGRYRALVV